MISTLHAKHIFASFTSRDATYDLIVNIWKLGHPTLKSTLNGVRLEGTGGDKTEKVDAEPPVEEDETHEGSETDDESDDEEELPPGKHQEQHSQVGRHLKSHRPLLEAPRTSQAQLLMHLLNAATRHHITTEWLATTLFRHHLARCTISCLAQLQLHSCRTGYRESRSA
ncbi:hypothetical protein LB505_001247 [Fusarium chuoi]|nr:hypothetical protein LB505_001247 [Fusarium chuoi]